MSSAARRWALVLLVSLAGCQDRVGGSADDADALHLSDLAGCPVRYPDGAPVDCTSRPIAPASAVRSGMACLEKLPSGNSILTIWGDSMGRVDLEYQINDFGRGKALGWMHVRLGDRDVFASFQGQAHGVLQPDFQGSQSREFAGTFGLYQAESTGSPEFLDDSRFDVAAGRYQDSAWFTWVFTNGADQYALTSMGRFIFDDGDVWLPTKLDARGTDFQVKVDVTKEMIANMRNTLPEPSNLPDLTPSC